jgi:hypothetical protein
LRNFPEYAPIHGLVFLGADSHNRVVWADQWSDDRIDAGRKKDSRARTAYFNKKCASEAEGPSSAVLKNGNKKKKGSLKGKLKKWFGVKDSEPDQNI